jgi:hypothetical protein
MPELVGPTEIARRFGVTPGAVSHWISRSRRGNPRPLRPRFPPSYTIGGKTWSWPEVKKWGAKWQEYHPGALPGLARERDYPAQALDDVTDALHEYPVSKTVVDLSKYQ